MRPFKKIIFFAPLIALALAAAATFAQEGIARFTIDNLSSAKTGSFPKGWRTWPFWGNKAEKIYHVREENGVKFIRAFDDQDISVQIFRNFDWPVEERPMLSWTWRATELPDDAAENDDAKNDSACGVYVVVGKWTGHALKYVWSSTLAPGTIITRKNGKLKMKVLDSGPAKKGQWVFHTVDVMKDYRELFGKPLDKNPSGIGLLTDGNAVHKPAGCDYRNFSVSAE